MAGIAKVLSGPGYFDLRPLCVKGDLKNIKEYWNRFNDQLEQKGPEGTTPLHEAARHGHIEVVAFLLSKGANINATTSSNGAATPLYLASEAGHKNCQLILLSHQASAIDCYQTRDGPFLRVMTGEDHDIPANDREALLLDALMVAARLELLHTIEQLLPKAFSLLPPVIKEAKKHKKHKSTALLKIAHSVVTGNLELLKNLYNTTSKSAITQEVKTAAQQVPTTAVLKLAKVIFDHRIYREVLIHTRVGRGLEIDWSGLDVYDECVDDLYVLRSISSVASLSLARNELTCIGDSFGALDNLRVLDLSSNSIAQISSALLHLPCLWSLNLSDNLLSTLPSPEHEVELTHLDLSSNKFQKVPNVIKNLYRLSYLNISHNGIKSLPLWVSSLDYLEDLRMEGLEITDRQLKECSTEGAMTYLQSQLDNSRKLYEMKMVITGVPGAGKTSLVNQLRDSLPSSYEATPFNKGGVSVSNWLYKKSSESKEYEFIIWDIKSNRDRRSVEELLYTPFALYLIVFNLNNLASDFPLLQQRLDAICKHSLPSCVLFVGTHLDAIADPLIPEKAKSQLSDLISGYSKKLIFARAIMETVSLATGNIQNVGQVRDAIFDLSGRLRNTDGLLYMGRRVLLSGLGLKGEVEEYSRQASQNAKPPVLTYEEIEKLVSNLKDNEVRGHDELETISQFLNQVGCLLKYSGPGCKRTLSTPAPPIEITNNLQDSYYMDPDWLYNKAQLVINYSHPKYNGMFHYKDIEEYICQIEAAQDRVSNGVVPVLPLMSALVHFGFISALRDMWFANPNLFQQNPQAHHSPPFSLNSFSHIQHYLFEAPRSFTTFLISVINKVVPLSDFTTGTRGSLSNEDTLLCWDREVAWSNEDERILITEEIKERRGENRESRFVRLTVKYSSPCRHAQCLEGLSSLVEEHFPKATASYVCPTCIAGQSNQMQSFTLPEIISSIVTQGGSTTCPDNHCVPLAMVVPFLSIQPTHSMTELRLGLPSMQYYTSEQCRLMYKAMYKGQNVLVFKYHRLTETTLRELTSKSLSLGKYNTPCSTSQDGRLLALSIDRSQALIVCKTPLLRVSPSQMKLPRKLEISKPFVLYRIGLIIAKALSQVESIGDDEGELQFWSLDEKCVTNCTLALSDITLRRNMTNAIGSRGEPIAGNGSLSNVEKNKLNLWSQYMTSLAQTSLSTSPFYLLKILKSGSILSTSLDSIIHLMSQVSVQLIGDTQSITGLQLPVQASGMPSLCGSASGIVADLWMASLYKGKEELRISVYDIINHVLKIFKVKSPLLEVLAIEVCNDNVWVSTQLPDDVGCISIFNSNTKKLVHNIKMSGNAITCIERVGAEVCLGTKMGFLFIFPVNASDVKKGSPKPRHKFIAEGIITGLASMGDRLFIANSDCIYIFDPNLMKFVSSFHTKSDGGDTKDNQIGRLYISQCEPVLYSISTGSTVVRVWDIAESKHLYDIKIQDGGEKREGDAERRITALTSCIDTVWLGLSSGHILVYHNDELVLSMQPYSGPISFLSRFVDGRGCAVISGGEGFLSPVPSFDSKYDNECPVLVLWKVYPRDSLVRLRELQENRGQYLNDYTSLVSLIESNDYEFTSFHDIGESSTAKQGNTVVFEPFSPVGLASRSDDDEIPVQLSNGKLLSVPAGTSMASLYESILSQTKEYNYDSLSCQNLIYYYQSFDTPVNLSTDDDLLSYLEIPDRPVLMFICEK